MASKMHQGARSDAAVLRGKAKVVRAQGDDHFANVLERAAEAVATLGEVVQAVHARGFSQPRHEQYSVVWPDYPK